MEYPCGASDAYYLLAIAEAARALPSPVVEDDYGFLSCQMCGDFESVAPAHLLEHIPGCPWLRLKEALNQES